LGDAPKVHFEESKLSLAVPARRTVVTLVLRAGNGDECWKRSIETELKKASAFRGAKPTLARYIYLADPATECKQELIELEEPNLINGMQGFSEAEATKFVRALEGRSPAP
jgi:hypothetical protein